MATPTLTNAAGVVFTFNETDVENVQTSITANLDFDSMPASPATSALAFDFNGASKTITINGKITLATSTRTSVGNITAIDDQRKWLESFIDGLQLGNTFTSNYSSSWNGSAWVNSKVLVGTVTFSEQTGEPNFLSFSMQLIVGEV